MNQTKDLIEVNMPSKGSRENRKLYAQYESVCYATVGRRHNPDLSFFEWKKENGYIKESEYIVLR